jgi:hypothetical protein
MTLLALGPGVSPGYNVLTGHGVLNLTALSMAAIAGNTGITFPNITGTTLVLAKTVTGDPGAKITPGAQILGVSIAPIAFVEGVAGNLYLLGPFFTQDCLPGTNTIEMDFTTPANLSGISVLQPAGVY